MPSTEKSAYWFVRVDAPETFLRDKLKELSNAIDTIKLLALFHLGEKRDNPHCHFTLQTNVAIQKQSFAVRIKKMFDIVSKSSYAISVWDMSDSANSYMFHESNEVILVNKGYTEEDLKRFRAMNAETQKIVEINKKRAPGRCVDKLITLYKQQDYIPERADILEQLLEWIRDGEMYEPGSYQLEKYMEEVYLKTRPASQWRDYVDRRVGAILSKINF